MTPAFLLCISFNFVMIENPEIYIRDSSLQTLCNQTDNLIKLSNNKNIDPFVTTALIYHESRWEKNQTGSSGDCGLMQVLHKYVPGKSCKDLHNPIINIQAGLNTLSLFRSYLKKKKRPHKIEDVLKCYPSGYRCKCKRCKGYSNKIINLANKLRKKYYVIIKTIGTNNENNFASLSIK